MITIGELAKRAGCTIPTIRYYEAIELLPKPQRRGSGHRTYRRSDLAKLILIRRCRDLDMPLDRIKDLMVLQDNGKPCQETLGFVTAQREIIKARIKSLQELDFSLSLHQNRCQTGCLQTNEPCEIFDNLAAE